MEHWGALHLQTAEPLIQDVTSTKPWLSQIVYYFFISLTLSTAKHSKKQTTISALNIPLGQTAEAKTLTKRRHDCRL